jgi:hypothetical protein
MDNPTFKNHFWGNFDKILLSAFIVFFCAFAYFATRQKESTFVAAMLDNTKTMIGTLLGLMTGRAIGRMEERYATIKTLPPTPTEGAK